MIEDTRCQLCHCYMDREDLFCSNCGTENPTGVDVEGVGIEAGKVATAQQASVLSFRCNSCGASMSYDASAKTLRCPFCGSEQMTSRPDARTLRPDGIVPFVVDQQNVERLLRQWLAQGIWRPGDAAQRSVIEKVAPVYVPFWVFSAETGTSWTADSSSVPMGARGNWRPVAGTCEHRYDGILVGASGTLTPREIDDIAPFDLSAAVSPDGVDLKNVIVEEFRITRRDARMRVFSIVEQLEANQAGQSVPGRARNVQVNVRVSEMVSRPVLLPVWIMVFQYNNHPFRVLINGQTGEVCGTAPVSYVKVTVAVIVMFLIVLLMMIIVAIAFEVR